MSGTIHTEKNEPGFSTPLPLAQLNSVFNFSKVFEQQEKTSQYGRFFVVALGGTQLSSSLFPLSLPCLPVSSDAFLSTRVLPTTQSVNSEDY